MKEEFDITIDDRTANMLDTLKAITLESYKRDGYDEETVNRLRDVFTDNHLIYMAVEALVSIYNKRGIHDNGLSH